MAFFGNLTNFDYKTSEWQIFHSKLNQFFVVNKVEEESDKRALLFTHITDDTYHLLRNLAHPYVVEELEFKELVRLLDGHFKKKQCTYADKARFYAATRGPSETLGDWAARLRGLAIFCNFGAALEANLADRFILGLGSGPERDKLFENTATLTMAAALEIAEKAAVAREAKTEMAVTIKEEPVYYGASGSGQGRGGWDKARRGGGGTVTRPGGGNQPQRYDLRCSICGMRNHDADSCRYKRYRCQKCGIIGHLKKVCKSKSSRVNCITSEPEQNVIEEVEECCTECHNFNLRYVSNKPIILDVILGGKNISMQLDSGSGVCVIGDKLYYEMFSEHRLEKCNIKMCFYNGHKISPLGYFQTGATYNGETRKINFFVVVNGGPPLLGRDFMSAFSMALTTNVNSICDGNDIDVNQLLERYPDIWRDELGAFNKFKVHLRLKENSCPKFFKPRTVPFALKDKVEEELNRLVKLGVLVPVNHSEYATPIVPVLKESGKVRIAGDFSVTLNKDLVVDKYPLPRIEEVFAKLGGGEHYSKIDLKNAYNQFMLDESSQELTTINTSKGLFKYTRLVYGLSNGPAVFQKSMETLLTGIDGVSCWLDDICVTGPNKILHLKRLNEVLSRINDAGLRVQKEKCEFFKPNVTYLGYVISKEGLQTCPDKVQAILNAPEPTNVTEVKRFLGVVNYYRSFIPKAATLMSPLHELLRAGAEWEWGERQRGAVHAVRHELVSDRVLAHFEPSAQLVLSVDAGPGGLGALLAQRAADGQERPLAFASRSLTKSERNYSQIQKEATAIIFGVKRFHQYLYGRSDPFILKTDHRPLVSIFNTQNGISATSALRLQRYAIILSAYTYKIQYVSSGNNLVADYFSRAPLPSTSSDSDNEFDTLCALNFLDSVSPAVTSDDIKKATDSDITLQTVIKYMHQGWPRKINCKSVEPYFNCRTDLQLENGSLLRGHKVVIPLSLRQRMLSELHSTHLGIVKMKCNARTRMWWPGIDGDIERCAGACGPCVALRPAPPREPPAPWPRAPGPWNRVHIDYMSIGQRVYLIVVDSYSKWVECLHMQNGTSTQSLISKLKYLFSIFGIPEVLVSDNDVKIHCVEFRLFCSSNGIKYMNSPVYHPNSNGQAENSVRICKKMLKHVLNENVTTHLVHEKLLSYSFNYRNSVHCTTGETPAKLMFGRKLKTRLDLILPSDRPTRASDDNSATSVCIHKRQFQVGNIVWARWYSARKVNWELGEIIEKIGNKMFKIFVNKYDSYCVRHVDQLLKYKGHSITNTHMKDNVVSNDRVPLPSFLSPSVQKDMSILASDSAMDNVVPTETMIEETRQEQTGNEIGMDEGETGERGPSAHESAAAPASPARAPSAAVPTAPPITVSDEPYSVRHQLRPRKEVRYKV